MQPVLRLAAGPGSEGRQAVMGLQPCLCSEEGGAHW